MRRALALALIAAALGCELPTTTLAPRSPALVVHAVLNPYLCRQSVVVEELLVGQRRDTAAGGSFGGRMVTDARVVVRSEAGDSAIAAQRFGPAGNPLGLYDLDNRACYGSDAPERMPIVQGRRYFLSVSTPAGQRLTGETVIPTAGGQVQVSGPFVYNIDRDSLTVSAPRASAGARYFVSVTPTGRASVTLPLPEPRARFRGQVEIIEDFDRGLVFWPALPNEVLIVAADPHYAEYISSYSDPVTGRGQVHGVTGGFGVFGSVTPLGGVLVEVTTTADEPMEGTWRRVRADTSDVEFVRLYYDEREQGLASRPFFASVELRGVGRVWVTAFAHGATTGVLDLPDLGGGFAFRRFDIQLQRSGIDTLRLSEEGGRTTRYTRVGPLSR